jgi:hypothetical protein
VGWGGENGRCMRTFFTVAKVLVVVGLFGFVAWLVVWHEARKDGEVHRLTEDLMAKNQVERWVSKAFADPDAEVMDLSVEYPFEGKQWRDVQVRARNGFGGWVIAEYKLEFQQGRLVNAKRVKD